VTTCDVIFVNVIQVPTGYATFALESIVNVRALASVDGWSIDLPASSKTVVYAALCEFDRILSVPTFTPSTAILPADTRVILVSVACQSSIC
jgi:hypothetical protein